MMTVLFFKQVGTLQLSSYGIMVITSSCCVKLCTVRTIEQVILNLDYHGILVNIIFRS